MHSGGSPIHFKRDGPSSSQPNTLFEALLLNFIGGLPDCMQSDLLVPLDTNDDSTNYPSIFLKPILPPPLSLLRLFLLSCYPIQLDRPLAPALPFAPALPHVRNRRTWLSKARSWWYMLL